LLPGAVVLSGVLDVPEFGEVVAEFGEVVPEFGEAVPGVGEAVPGVGDAVPGVGAAVPGLLPGVPVWPGFDLVPEFCPLGEAELLPTCPVLEPAAEPAVPADPACISGVNTAADNTGPCADWASNQHVKSNKTNRIGIFVFMGLEASKENNAQLAFCIECRGAGTEVRIQWTP
jgi:hypothetical protein